MITIQDIPQIEALQNQLVRRLKAHATITRRPIIGWNGGNRPCAVQYAPDYNFWYFSEINYDNPKVPKFLNVLASGEPIDGQRLSAPCQINFPAHINSRVGGAFAADDDKQIYILHTGAIHGFTRAMFWEHFKGSKISANHNGKLEEYALIGSLDRDDLRAQISFFVAEIERLKQLRPQ